LPQNSAAGVRSINLIGSVEVLTNRHRWTDSVRVSKRDFAMVENIKRYPAGLGQA
jgi:hypothetical protein